MEKEYIKALEIFKEFSDQVQDTRMMALAKIASVIKINMCYETIMIDRNLSTHPYKLVSEFIRNAHSELKTWEDVSFIEDKEKSFSIRKVKPKEVFHKSLFQKLWTKFSFEEYQDRIARYVYRLKINDLGNGWLKGFRCIDFGCGHGNFAHALLQEGADSVIGIDFGKDNVAFARSVRDKIGISSDKLEFYEKSVYDTSQKSNDFDFAIQNGVFHHLEDENSAYREVYRVLKPGGWFWIYTEGSGGISHDLWDASLYILRNIPSDLVLEYLDFLNVETGKRYHLGDSLNAKYNNTTWDEITNRLNEIGFCNFRRLSGGYSTDCDLDTINSDKWGIEKFGEGDLRILAQKKE